ncbi:MAG: MATE family efflux transporter [Ruminococcaceae bacterium]|nr:MATE family efflux transporter [Oscillospiraceae bacterium]
MAASKVKRNLTDGPLLPKMILFTLPLIATAFLQQLFNTADTVVVGQWGGNTPAERETALAAVGSCGALINLIVNLFFGLSVGAGVCVAHDIGAKQYRDVKRTVHTSVIVSLFFGALLTVFGLCMARPLLAMMKTDPTVLDEAVPYMMAYFCGMPANILYNYCASILRSSGDTTRPLIFLSAAGVANVGLNLVMVLVFGLGALGVGIATAASHWVACVLILIYMMRMDGPCKIELRELRVYPEKLKKIIVIGLPAGLQGTLFSFSNVLIQSSINGFGNVAFVAGNTAASNIDSYIYASQNALYHTALTFVGQNLGAKKLDRVKRSILLSACVVTVVGLSVGCLALLFGRPLLSIFTDGTAVIDAGMIRLSIMGVTYFLCGLMEVGCGVMRGFGKSLPPMIVSLVGSCLFRIVWIYTIFAAFPTPFMLYLSYPISWILTAGTHFLFCGLTYRKIKQHIANES